MPDSIDLAQERDERLREEALALHRNHSKPVGPSAYFCRSCGDRIEEKRRLAVPGTQYCTFCASQIDKGAR